jgi:uncharacterized protein YlxP (DUF503 family)
MTALVAYAKVSLDMPGNTSLKDKRREVRSVQDRVRARFNASCAEVGDPGSIRRATLAFTLVGPDEALLREELRRLESLVVGRLGHAVESWNSFLPVFGDQYPFRHFRTAGEGPAPRHRLVPIDQALMMAEKGADLGGGIEGPEGEDEAGRAARLEAARERTISAVLEYQAVQGRLGDHRRVDAAAASSDDLDEFYYRRGIDSDSDDDDDDRVRRQRGRK